MAPYRYRVYDLEITSDIPIPEFTPGGSGRDAAVLLRNAAPLNGHKIGWEFLSPEEGLLRTEYGSFLLREGREIIITPAGSHESVLRMYLLGGVMAALLFQRGLLPVHASAVALGGEEAVLFVGEQGQGKSTTAASLYQRGHKVIADDVAAIDVGDPVSRVMPGFPLLKLYPAVGDYLGSDTASHWFFHELESKRGLPVGNTFRTEPAPLRAIFLLARGEKPLLHPLPPATALVTLLQHSWPTRLNLPGDAAHFQKCASLARAIPIYRLERPHPFEQLEAVCGLIEGEMERLCALTPA